MYIFSFFIYLSLVCIVIITCNASLEPLNYERVRFLQLFNGNYIFRGNQPELNGSFAYDTLNKFLNQRAQEANTSLPPSYYLVDISLLDPNDTEEGPALQVEFEFFKTNPQLGQVISWPLQGDTLGPSSYNESTVLKMAGDLSNWQPDDLPDKNYAIRRIILDGVEGISLPIVVYIHCGHGQDRTGELAGSYLLQYLSIPFFQIWNTNIEMGMDVVQNENALQWFCEYFALMVQANNTLFCHTNSSSSSFVPLLNSF